MQTLDRLFPLHKSIPRLAIVLARESEHSRTYSAWSKPPRNSIESTLNGLNKELAGALGLSRRIYITPGRSHSQESL